MRLLLFGGSFDPPHRAHRALLDAAMRELRPDRTLVLPAFRSPLKAPCRASPGQRLDLLRRALPGGVLIDAFELERARRTFTYEALRRMKRLYPGAELFFLVGSDSLETFHLWKRPQELRRACRFVVGRRPGAKPPPFPGARFLRGTFPDVASTEVRTRLLCGLSVRGLLDERVERRVLELGLYGTDIHDALYRELKPARYRHTLAVARTALTLARRHGLDPERAALSGLLHDCGRVMSPKAMARYCRKHRLRAPAHSDILENRPSLLHAYVGADLARRRFGVEDPDILSAVRSHTLGAPRMSPLEKLIYAADACSDDREFPEAARIRRLAEKSLEEGFRETVRSKLQHVLQYGAWMHPLGPALWNASIG